MSGVLGYLRQALAIPRSQASNSLLNKVTATTRDLTHFSEGDRVLVDGEKLTPPLQRNARFDTPKGQLQHKDILGKPFAPCYVRASKGTIHKIEPPSLEDYVTNTPRLVTPVYASYATSIVSLLDIHPEPFEGRNHLNRNDVPKIEILEAGTGHGSLTLHVARAIAGANPPPPNVDMPKLRAADFKSTESPTNSQRDTNADQESLVQTWTEWKHSRRAVLHTVENVVANRFHAEKIVRGFRHGLYWPHIDFHAADVKSWIKEQWTRRHDGRTNRSPLPSSNTVSPGENETAFLTHVLLDMPSVHRQLRDIAPAMCNGAKLIVFVPSITQIGECVRIISEEDLPLNMERTLELGEGISTGRRWDVRFVRPRRGKNTATKPAAVTPTAAPEQDAIPKTGSELSEEGVNPNEDAPGSTPEESSPDRDFDPQQDDSPVMICRPLVGERTFGGGFIALFKKIAPAHASLAAEWRQSRTGWAKRRNR